MLVLQVELEDAVENIGAKLVRQAAAKTNDLAGDGTTTSVVLAQGLITEGVKVSSLFFTVFESGFSSILSRIFAGDTWLRAGWKGEEGEVGFEAMNIVT